MEFLNVAFTGGIGDHRVFDGHLQASGREQFLHSIAGLIHGGARFRESAIEKRNGFADGLAQFRIGEPRDVVKIDGNAGRFFYMVGHKHAGAARLEAVIHFRE